MIIGEGDFAQLVLEVAKRLNLTCIENKSNCISQASSQIGLQNVFDKYVQIEERQKAIEELLNSDELAPIINSIPKQEDLIQLMKKIESTEIGRLNKYLNSIKNDLDKLMDVFNR